LILSPAPLHGYNAAQEQAWDDAIRHQLRIPDDGVPLSVFDWMDLNALAHHAFCRQGRKIGYGSGGNSP